jgi:cobalt-zinc-cadmium efflux system protein
LDNPKSVDPARHSSQKRLRLALTITLTFLAAEAIGGILTNSLALLSDAGHMLIDVTSLGVSLIALRLANRPTTPEKTYGFYRAEILAAFINGASLVFIALYIFYEAYQRLGTPPQVKSLPMLIIATVGLAANLLTGAVLFRAKEDNLNIRGAYFHVFSDAIGSLGAIAAGIIMLLTQWYYADTVISIFICGLIAYSSVKILRESTNILMEGTPSAIDYGEVKETLCSIDGVESVHDLHIWTITSGKDTLSGHITVRGNATTENIQQLLERIRHVLQQKFGVSHTTIQIEPKAFDVSDDFYIAENNGGT